MAAAGFNVDQDQFNCSVCLDLLKDPVTIPCGHNFCKVCINRFWDEEDQKKLYSCPQCRETFTPRPVLGRNNMLAEVVEKIKRIELQAASADVECDSYGIKKRRAGNSHLVSQTSYSEDQLQPHSPSPAFKKHKLVETCDELQEKIFSEHKKTNESYCSTDQSCKVHLCNVDKHQSPDPGSAKLSCPSLCVSPGCDDTPSFTVNHHLSFDGTRESLTYLTERDEKTCQKEFDGTMESLTDLTERDEKTCEKEFNKISPQAAAVQMILPSEPKSREDFLQYFCYLVLDPNTAHHQLTLSEKNIEAKHSRAEQRYSDHPERFVSRPQVLCTECVCERCYWEVEWSGCVSISVSYKEISRRGGGNKCGFGYNSQSWSLRCSSSSVSFWHNDVQTKLRGPAFSRIGVYVDHSAGTLSYYNVSDTMELLHRVHTTFTQPLYAGFRIWYNSTMRLFDPNVSQSV